jgi:hypothetical protein
MRQLIAKPPPFIGKSMRLVRLQELKRKLMKEKEFSKTWTFYMDEFADHPEFLEVGEPVKHDFLEAAILGICQKMFSKNIKVSASLIIYIEKHQFFHAPIQVSGRSGGVIFFADINMGLLAITAKNPPTAEVMYSRFSGPPKLEEPSPYERN